MWRNRLGSAEKVVIDVEIQVEWSLLSRYASPFWSVDRLGRKATDGDGRQMPAMYKRLERLVTSMICDLRRW